MITKEEQRLIVRSGGSARAQTRVLGVVLACASFGVSSVICIWVVSVRDWSAMFARDGEEYQRVVRAYISAADAAERTRRRGQGAKGSRCGSGWVRASSG